MFTDSLDTLQIWLRLLAAIGAGALLGWERQARHKAAGFRTHMLVSLGAASFTLVAAQIYAESARLLEGSPGDPTRIVQGIVTGIGFLGAGAIIRQQQGVRGLTTAASVWVAGALGVACGSGAYVVALLAATHALIVLAALKGLPEQAQDQLQELREKGNGDAD